MRAVILQNQMELVDGEFPMPVPKEDEVLIRIKASGFNPIDYQMLENELERKLIRSPVLGRELSGVVVEKGANVHEFSIGDEVYCSSGSMGSNGSYAEYIAVPEAILALKPRDLSFEAAAGIPSAGITALQIFRRLEQYWNQKIVITGATGGVGSFLIQILIAHGFQENLYAIYGNATGYEKLQRLGVKKANLKDYKETSWVNELKTEHAFDVVVDLVGGSISEASADLLKVNGIYVDVTALTTDDARELLFNKGIVVYHISNFAYAFIGDYAYYKRSLEQLSTWINDSVVYGVDYEVVGELSLATVKEAHKRLKTNTTNARKLVMKQS